MDVFDATHLWDGVTSILNITSDPSRRTFWLFLLSALAIALISVSYRHYNNRHNKNRHNQTRDNKSFTSLLFDSHSFKTYLRHPSHLTDMALLAFNTIVKVALVIPLMGGHIAATIFFVSLLQNNLGNAPVFALSAGVVVFLYSVTFFVMEDLSRFTVHKLMHDIPFLWRFHKIHHSAEVLSPLTVYRVHPIEMFIYYCRGMIVFGAVTGVFVYFFQSKVDAYDILGVDLLGFIFNFMGANLRHSHIWVSFGFFERWFISPAQHQIHHSKAPEHINKNYGTCLAIWDKLFRSWVPAESFQKLSFGVVR